MVISKRAGTSITVDNRNRATPLLSASNQVANTAILTFSLKVSRTPI